MVNPRQKLPAWYHRLLALTMKEDRDVYPEDFDEDLSDLEDSSEVEEEEERASMRSECRCDREYCEYESQNQDDEDAYDSDGRISDRSYDGSDAGYYYELKDEREERKRELQNIRELVQKAKEEQQTFERNKEKEVQSAYESLKFGKEGKTAFLDAIASQIFHLYSPDYVNHCYSSDHYPPKYVEFYYLDENGPLPHSKPLSDREARQMEGHIYFNGNTGCNFGPFSSSKLASLDNCQLQSVDGKYDLTIQFLSDDYLKLKVGHELVFMDKSQPPHAPEFFEFVGIRYDREKEKAERERWKAQVRVQRSPSPRESWFEMNHPMGWWNQPWNMP
jgi:hypothetical protein